MRDQAPRLLIPEFCPFSTNSPVHNHGSWNDPNLFAGHLTWSYREFQSIKQKAFVRNRADHATVNSILGHLSPTTFHNKESWGQYARIIPFVPHPHHVYSPPLLTWSPHSLQQCHWGTYWPCVAIRPKRFAHTRLCMPPCSPLSPHQMMQHGMHTTHHLLPFVTQHKHPKLTASGYAATSTMTSTMNAHSRLC